MNKVLLATIISFSFSGLTFASSDRSDYGHAQIDQQIMESRAQFANKITQAKNFRELDADERAILFHESVENGSAQAHQNFIKKHLKEIHERENGKISI